MARLRLTYAFASRASPANTRHVRISEPFPSEEEEEEESDAEARMGRPGLTGHFSQLQCTDDSDDP